jgi:hypothetical protein
MEMGKGGGSQPTPPTHTTSTVTQSNLPGYVEPFFTNVLERTEAESLRPYEPFPGQRLAEFSPEQRESFVAAGDIARGGPPPQLGAASQRLGEAAAYRPGYVPGTFDPGDFTAPGVAAKYQNPFIENVIDVQQARARRQFEEDMVPQLAARATQAGAFGGSREAVAEQLARSRLDDRLADLESTQRAQAYREAGGLFERDRTAALRAQGLQEQAAQQQARLSIAGQQLGIQAATRLAPLGEREQALGLQQADVLRQIGEQERAFEQQQLDIGLADFLSQRDFPRQQLAYYGGILHGVPVTPDQEVSQFQAQPSMGQQMLGYGLGGLGLARSMMG